MKPEADRAHWKEMMDSLMNPERRENAQKLEKKKQRREMKMRDAGFYE
jgi:hypothetical protein